MAHRRPINETALKRLYVVERRSAAEIAKVLECSEHKVNYWLEKHVITKRNISDAVYYRKNPGGDPFLFTPPKNVAEAELFGLGIGLYWGEGNRRNKFAVRLGNTDPALIKKFLEFLVKIFNVKKAKLRFGLQIFGDMPRTKALDFWLNALKEFGIRRTQFFKITVTPHRGVGNYRTKTQHGVLTVHFNNSKLKKLFDSMVPR